jgi:hypothetical protein
LPIAVDVMNFFVRCQSAADLLFGHPPVLHHPSIVAA